MAIAEDGRAPVFNSTIQSTGTLVAKLASKLSGSGASLRFFYEAGSCGLGDYRQMRTVGHECAVVAPSLIPRRLGGTDQDGPSRRFVLARLHRNEKLTALLVPDEEPEATRDMELTREDYKHTERRVRQRLNGFLLRHGRIYAGGCRWNLAHYRWLETQHFIHPAQQIVFQEYVD